MANDKNLPTTNDMPIFYMYQTKDGWYKTDARLTSELNHAFLIRGDRNFNNAAKVSFYPQFRAPDIAPNASEAEKARKLHKPAWRITSDNEIVARWRWQTCQHKASHKTCKPNGDGTCERQVLVTLHYDASKKLWIQD